MKFLLLITLCLFSLNSGAAEKLHVVTTISTLKALADEVGGDKVDVISLSKGYMDPHFVEGKPNLVLDLHRADLLIHVGLELEIGWLPPLILGARNSKIRQGEMGNLEAASLIHVLKIPTTKVDRSMGDIHPQGNPHFWIPPKNALLIAKGISERLKKIQPESASYFDSQYQTFSKKLGEVEKELAPKIKKLKGLKVVPYHDSWAYVSDWLGLDEVGYVEIKPGVPPDPKHLANLIEMMRAEKISVILKENFYNRDIAESVANKSGAKLLDMPSDVGATSEIKTYFDLIRAVVNTLL